MEDFDFGYCFVHSKCKLKEFCKTCASTFANRKHKLGVERFSSVGPKVAQYPEDQKAIFARNFSKDFQCDVFVEGVVFCQACLNEKPHRHETTPIGRAFGLLEQDYQQFVDCSLDQKAVIDQQVLDLKRTIDICNELINIYRFKLWYTETSQNMGFDQPSATSSREAFEQVFNFYFNFSEYRSSLEINPSALNFLPQTLNLLFGVRGRSGVEAVQQAEPDSRQINSFNRSPSRSQNNVDRSLSHAKPNYSVHQAMEANPNNRRKIQQQARFEDPKPLPSRQAEFSEKKQSSPPIKKRQPSSEQDWEHLYRQPLKEEQQPRDQPPLLKPPSVSKEPFIHPDRKMAFDVPEPVMQPQRLERQSPPRHQVPPRSSEVERISRASPSKQDRAAASGYGRGSSKIIPQKRSPPDSLQPEHEAEKRQRLASPPKPQPRPNAPRYGRGQRGRPAPRQEPVQQAQIPSNPLESRSRVQNQNPPPDEQFLPPQPWNTSSESEQPLQRALESSERPYSSRQPSVSSNKDSIVDEGQDLMKRRHYLNLLNEKDEEYISSFNFMQNPNLFVYAVEGRGFFIRNLKESGNTRPLAEVPFNEFIDEPIRGGSSYRLDDQVYRLIKDIYEHQSPENERLLIVVSINKIYIFHDKHQGRWTMLKPVQQVGYLDELQDSVVSTYNHQNATLYFTDRSYLMAISPSVDLAHKKKVFQLPKKLEGEKITAVRTLYNVASKVTHFYIGLSNGLVLISDDQAMEFDDTSLLVSHYQMFKNGEAVAFLGFYEDLNIINQSVFTVVAISSKGYLRLFNSPYTNFGQQQLSLEARRSAFPTCLHFDGMAGNSRLQIDTRYEEVKSCTILRSKRKIIVSTANRIMQINLPEYRITSDKNIQSIGDLTESFLCKYFRKTQFICSDVNFEHRDTNRGGVSQVDNRHTHLKDYRDYSSREYAFGICNGTQVFFYE